LLEIVAEKPDNEKVIHTGKDTQQELRYALGYSKYAFL